MKDKSNKFTSVLFPVGRPRKFKNNAEKMRIYRHEKRINKVMKCWNMTRDQAIRVIELGARVRS